MKAARDDTDLEERVAELETTVAALRNEIEQETPRGPLGLPRPPTPGEVLRFADESALPALIALLEATIKVLEALRSAITVIQRGEHLASRSDSTRERYVDRGKQQLHAVDRAIAELEEALSAVPHEAPGADILEDAKTIRGELADRIREAETQVHETTDGTPTETPSETSIDIESELESIKKEQQQPEDGSDESDNDDAEDSDTQD